MKKSIILFVLLISSISFAQNYTLIWSDEFLSSTIDQSNWTHETGAGGWGNNELQYYTNRTDNSYIENGSLVIEAKKENYSGAQYTSARLITRDKRFFKYGRIEARIKLPYGQGIWPAFWMLGQNIGTVGWPACGETDILEMIGGGTNDRTAYGTAHWDNNGQHASYGGHYTISSGKLADAYHVYAVEWTPQSIKWFFDGIQYHVIDITPAGLSEFHEQNFIILNLAVGGDWPGYPDGTTVFPQKMYVDYVRVYQDASAIPQVSLSEPLNGASFEANSDIDISADVEFDGEISKVEFYQGGALLGIKESAPYKWKIKNAFPGCYKIKAAAYNTDGFSGESDFAEISVGGECGLAPYRFHPANVPGKIQAEDFNLGGAGIAYNDADGVNSGNMYRRLDGVDIEACEDENAGYDIGWTEIGEWLTYLIDVKETADFQFHIRSSSESSVGKIHIEIDGVDETGTISLPATGDWQTWKTTISNSVALEAGIHTMKVYIESGNFNLNYIGIYKLDQQSEIELANPKGGEIFGVGEQLQISWSSVLVDNVSIGFSSNSGSSWSFVDDIYPAALENYFWTTPDIESDQCLIMVIDKSNPSVQSVSSTTFTISRTVDVKDPKLSNPNKYLLGNNYPNPFNPSTKIDYSIPSPGFVQLNVYDVLGSKVAELVNEYKTSGNYTIEFNASPLPSGIYFYELVSGNFRELKKLVLMK